jgi:hypothetical protein
MRLGGYFRTALAYAAPPTPNRSRKEALHPGLGILSVPFINT